MDLLPAMNPDSFEQKLARQQLRQVPDEWRDDILHAARTVGPRCEPATPRSSLLSVLNQKLSSLLWPHPRAWGALAAAWMVILVLSVAMRDDSTAAAHRLVPPSAQMRERLREQEQLLAELLEQQPAADPSKAIPPRPHSFYRNEFLNA